jgi:hypothetical protein
MWNQIDPSRRSKLLCALILPALGACSVQVPDQRVGIPSSSAAGFESVYKTTESHLRRTLREAITDSIRWDAVWDSLGGREQPMKALPEVDFAHNMLLAAAGPSLGSEDSVLISRVSPRGSGLEVEVTSYRNCYPPQIAVIPAHVVLVRRTKGPVNFVEDTTLGPECVPSLER